MALSLWDTLSLSWSRILTGNGGGASSSQIEPVGVLIRLSLEPKDGEGVGDNEELMVRDRGRISSLSGSSSVLLGRSRVSGIVTCSVNSNIGWGGANCESDRSNHWVEGSRCEVKLSRRSSRLKLFSFFADFDGVPFMKFEEILWWRGNVPPHTFPEVLSLDKDDWEVDNDMLSWVL